jgi:hypothetical protein
LLEFLFHILHKAHQAINESIRSLKSLASNVLHISLSPHPKSIFVNPKEKKTMRKHMFSTKMYTFMRKLTFFWTQRLSSHNKHPPPWSIRFSTTYSPSKKSYPINFMNPTRKENPISSIVPWTSLILELLQSTKTLTSTMFKNKTHISKIMEDKLVQILRFHANHNFNIDLICEPTLNFIVNDLVVMSMIIFKNWNLPLSQSYFPINKANN